MRVLVKLKTTYFESYITLLKDTLKAFDDFKNKQQKCMK